jgi:hypothetical protein
MASSASSASPAGDGLFNIIGLISLAPSGSISPSASFTTHHKAVAIQRTTKPSTFDAPQSRRHSTHHEAVNIRRTKKLSPSDAPQSRRHPTHYEAITIQRTHHRAITFDATKTPHATFASAASNNEIAARQ